MTTTSIKDLGNIMNLAVASAKGGKKSAESGFQSVLDSQTGGDSKETGKSRTVRDEDDRTKPGDALRAKDAAKKDVQKSTDRAEQEDGAKEATEAAMEVLESTVAELITQIASVFRMPEESVKELMGEMNLEAVDLLQPENLSKLLLEVAQVEDSLSLLTDEQLYADYQMIMEQAGAIREQVAEETGISPEELLNPETEALTIADEVLMVPKNDEKTVPETEDESKGPVITVQQTDEKQISATRNQSTESNAHEQQHREEPKSPEGSNLVLQTIKEQIAAPSAEAVMTQPEGSDVDTQNIMRQILDYMKVSVKPEMSDVEMQLHPASLGTLQIHVAAKDGVLTASFVTQNEAVKAALESQMVQLKESFEEQGMKVDVIEVAVGAHQFEQNLEQGRERQAREPFEGRRSTRTRRIQLDAAGELLPAEEMTADDKLAKEMMAANGGTVDYTV